MATGGDSKRRQAATLGDARLLDVATGGDTRRLVATPEAAKFLGLTVHSLRHKVARGLVPVVRIGRTVRFDLDALSEIAGSTSSAAPARRARRPETEDERFSRQWLEERHR